MLRFQYVSCQFDVLRDLQGQRAIREALKDLPDGLDATYDRILQSIHYNYRKQVANTLKWLAFSLRPLVVEELAEIFILDHDRNPPFDEGDRLFRPESVLNHLSSLVTKDPIGEVFWIRLAHFSIKEYLISPRIVQGPAKYFSTTEVDAHMHISEACSAYHLHLSLTILVTEKESKRFALWKYLRQYWVHHLDQVPQKSWRLPATDMALQVFAPSSQSLLNMIRLSDPETHGSPNWDLNLSQLAGPLYYMASIGAVQLAEFLLDGGYNINEQSDTTYGIALITAACGGHTSVVQLLLDRGADINAQGGSYGNALQIAVFRRHESIVQLLLDRGADINAQGGRFGNALLAAIAGDKLDSAELLLSWDAEVDLPGPQWEELLQKLAEEWNDEKVDRLRKFQEDPSGYIAATKAARRIG